MISTLTHAVEQMAHSQPALPAVQSFTLPVVLQTMNISVFHSVICVTTLCKCSIASTSITPLPYTRFCEYRSISVLQGFVHLRILYSIAWAFIYITLANTICNTRPESALGICSSTVHVQSLALQVVLVQSIGSKSLVYIGIPGIPYI